MKRSIDLLLALIAAIPLLPLGLVVALAVKLTSRGPALYWSDRVGANERIFRMPKFRTMKVGTPAVATHLMADPKSALTPIGGFLRRTSLDEIPQLWSVVAGEMSFVGPRPERPQFVEQLEQQIPFYAERHMVKPGITGWAQLNYPYGASIEDARHKLEYDLYYAKNYSPFLDALILVQTLRVILWPSGAR